MKEKVSGGTKGEKGTNKGRDLKLSSQGEQRLGRKSQKALIMFVCVGGRERERDYGGKKNQSTNGLIKFY